MSFPASLSADQKKSLASIRKLMKTNDREHLMQAIELIVGLGDEALIRPWLENIESTYKYITSPEISKQLKVEHRTWFVLNLIISAELEVSDLKKLDIALNAEELDLLSQCGHFFSHLSQLTINILDDKTTTAEISQFYGLQTLSINRNSINHVLIGELPKLKRLKLGSEVDQVSLGSVSELPNIEQIELSKFKQLKIEAYPKLWYLKLSISYSLVKNSKSFLNLPAFPVLTHFDFSWSVYSKSQSRFIFSGEASASSSTKEIRFPLFNKLETLNIYIDGKIIIETLPNLKKLSVRGDLSVEAPLVSLTDMSFARPYSDNYQFAFDQGTEITKIFPNLEKLHYEGPSKLNISDHQTLKDILIELTDRSSVIIENSPKLLNIKLEGSDRYKHFGVGKVFLSQLPINANIHIKKCIKYLCISSDNLKSEKDINIIYDQIYNSTRIIHFKITDSPNLTQYTFTNYSISHFSIGNTPQLKLIKSPATLSFVDDNPLMLKNLQVLIVNGKVDFGNLDLSTLKDLRIFHSKTSFSTQELHQISQLENLTDLMVKNTENTILYSHGNRWQDAALLRLKRYTELFLNKKSATVPSLPEHNQKKYLTAVRKLIKTSDFGELEQYLDQCPQDAIFEMAEGLSVDDQCLLQIQGFVEKATRVWERLTVALMIAKRTDLFQELSLLKLGDDKHITAKNLEFFNQTTMEIIDVQSCKNIEQDFLIYPAFNQRLEEDQAIYQKSLEIKQAKLASRTQSIPLAHTTIQDVNKLIVRASPLVDSTKVKSQQSCLYLPVKELKTLRAFYSTVLESSAVEVVNNELRIQIFEQQVIFYVNASVQSPIESVIEINGDRFFRPHLGFTLNFDVWLAFAKRLTQKQIDFILEPRLRFKGTKQQYVTFLIKDSADHILEFKASYSF